MMSLQFLSPMHPDDVYIYFFPQHTTGFIFPLVVRPVMLKTCNKTTFVFSSLKGGEKKVFSRMFVLLRVAERSKASSSVGTKDFINGLSRSGPSFSHFF